jgi:hypothetical protein
MAAQVIVIFTFVQVVSASIPFHSAWLAAPNIPMELVRGEEKPPSSSELFITPPDGGSRLA